MRCRRLVNCGVLLALALGAPAFAQAPAADEVRWRHDYNLARREAHEKNLPLVLDFGTENCYWCLQLDKITFRDPKVIAVMNEQFIPLKIDANREPQLTQALRIESYPTLVMAGPDGKILNSVVGFQDAAKFQELLQRVLATVTPPEWMLRDYRLADTAVKSRDLARAIPLLRGIVEDGKSRPVQVEAQKALQRLEQEGLERVKHAKQLHAQGKTAQALESLGETSRLYAGLSSAREAGDLLPRLAQGADSRTQQRSRRARELLAQAKEFYKAREYLLCLDRADLIITGFGDLPEGQEAQQLMTQLKGDPEWMQGAIDSLSERLSSMYLLMAESMARKGNPQQAAQYLERVIRTFPGTRQAESAQLRLQQLRSSTGTQPVEYRGLDSDHGVTPPTPPGE
jgi:thioredoxin-like negative regulator of GroEL